ncbi:fumarylacetoacetate hydrolase family protein [Paenibacillus silviterrae]|uniref:fumarylacetoacetate hydrolase family protein n=1 Tax=Paenibacillus silviterrae TaxID=3242194 RepID=UPI0025428B7A|nr:fumarylacetoacetate hydrolase family protein [Paenibacillus chinjuensis]
MKLVHFWSNDRLVMGVKSDRGILPLSEYYCSIEALMKHGREGLLRLEALLLEAEGRSRVWLDEKELRFGPCVPTPGKIICVGLNYRKHAVESKMPIPETPVLFSKYNNALNGHLQPVAIGQDVRQLDYEAELAMVIGVEARNVSADDALDYVLGYCNANDLSARDLQFRSTQWLLGKSCDGFCPLGPYLVTSDEVGDPDRLSITSKVNGEIRQSSNTADMIFSTSEIISYVSTYMTLKPGDVILTGTPEGVVLGAPECEQRWLQRGDIVTVEIEGLGALINQMV